MYVDGWKKIRCKGFKNAVQTNRNLGTGNGTEPCNKTYVFLNQNGHVHLLQNKREIKALNTRTLISRVDKKQNGTKRN